MIKRQGAGKRNRRRAMSNWNKPPLSLKDFAVSIDLAVTPSQERIVASKLNEETGEYEVSKDWIPLKNYSVSGLEEIVKDLWREYGTWDMSRRILDYPDRMNTDNLNKSKEINADFEVIEEVPEQKLLTKEMNKAPWTDKEVELLNIGQDGRDRHPYTCPHDGDKTHIEYEFRKEHEGESYAEYLEQEKAKGVKYPEMEFNQTSLIATTEGWRCPACNYKQDWY